jgi:CRP-like cAMP-binding protein
MLPDPIPHQNPRQNQLLAALGAADLVRLASGLERVSLRLGDMLYEPGTALQHAYFPDTAIVSLHYVMASGASAEAASVGREGMVGVALFTGADTTPSSAVVQTAGQAWRLDRHVLKREFERAGALQQVLLRYTQGLMVQMLQTAVCNRHHNVEQQLCRWLLMTVDRIPGDQAHAQGDGQGELTITQELVARMLGVRREGITEAAGKLQDAGLIHSRRGHIAVLDRAGLERYTCECYGVVKKEMARLQPVPLCE